MEKLYRNPENVKLVLEALYAATNEPMGTSYKSRHTKSEYIYAGKTGTSQIRAITAEEREAKIKNEDRPYKQRDHALFTAYAPYKNPRYAFSIIIEHGGSGSSGAAPIAKKLIKKVLDRDQMRKKQQPVKQETPVQLSDGGRLPEQTPRSLPEADPQAEDWAAKNRWFGTDRAMTFTAFEIHKDLVEKEGYDPKSNEYYEEIDKRIRVDFGHKFGNNETKQTNRAVQSVASANRSSKPGRKQVRLTSSQVAIAKKLGVPLEEYAKQLKNTKEGA